MTVTAAEAAELDLMAADYQAADEAGQAAILAELRRRDRADRDQAARDAERAEWETMAYAQYQAAERQCNGYLIRHESRVRHEFSEDAPRQQRIDPGSEDAAEIRPRRVLCATCGHPLRHPWHEGTSPFILWEGDERWARKYASEELCAFWDASPRITVTAWRQQVSDGRRIQRDDRDAETIKGETVTEQTAAEAAPAADRAPSGLTREQRYAAALARARQDVADRTAQYRAARAVQAPQPQAQVAVRGAQVARTTPDAVVLLRRVLDGIGLLLTDYVAFPSRSAVIGSDLWTAQAAARDSEGELIWRAYVRLLVTSRQNGSGKSTLGDLVSMLLQCRAGRMSKVTPYGLTKVLGTLKEAAIADDAQNVFRNDKAGTDLLTIMINGYTRGATWVTGKSDGKIEPASGPVMIIGKDELITKRADYLKDLIDRSAVVRLERPDRYMPEVDEEAEKRARVLAVALKAVMGSLQPQLRQAARELAEENRGRLITDGDGGRTAQIWRPMLATARVAGGPWPEAAQQAMEELSAASGDLLKAEDAMAGLASLDGSGDTGRSFWEETS